MRRILLLALLLLSVTASAQSSGTLRGQMARMESLYGVHFVYDAGLPVDQPAPTHVQARLSLRQNLSAVFRDTGIDWEVKRDYGSGR